MKKSEKKNPPEYFIGACLFISVILACGGFLLLARNESVKGPGLAVAAVGFLCQFIFTVYLLKQNQKTPVPQKTVEKRKAAGEAAADNASETLVSLKKQLRAQRSAVGLVFVDNYEEVLESIEDSSIPLLTALIERKLNSLAASVEGIIKKFERDRYLFLLSYEKLEEIKEKKFEILNEIREINIGDHIPVTLSIGICAGEASLDLAMRGAKSAMDLALGRGGDQALVKEGEKYLFYGGKSGEVSHNARIRARVKADALSALIDEADLVLIMGHRQADLDSMGSCIGLSRIAKALGKECHIVLDTVSVGIRRLHSRMLAEAEYQSLFLTGGDAVRKMTEQTLLVIADTHKASLVEHRPVLEEAKKVVVFDHHRKSTEFIDNAVLIYHEPYASSTSELVTEVIQYIGEKIRLKPVEADALLGGITIDTKNFCIKTGAITFEVAAYLRRNGADSVRVRLLLQENMQEYKAKAAAVKDARIIYDDIAISVCPYYDGNTSLTAAQAADELLTLEGIKASFVICQTKELLYISARSLGDVNVQVIMEKLGGGGHMTVSGVQLKDVGLAEAEMLLKRAIAEYIQEVS